MSNYSQCKMTNKFGNLRPCALLFLDAICQSLRWGVKDELLN